MTRYEKLAISLPHRAAESVRNAVKAGKAESASSYIARAIEAQARIDDGDLFAEVLASTGGPLTTTEQRQVDREMALAKRQWQGSGPSRRRR